MRFKSTRTEHKRPSIVHIDTQLNSILLSQTVREFKIVQIILQRAEYSNNNLNSINGYFAQRIYGSQKQIVDYLQNRLHTGTIHGSSTIQCANSECVASQYMNGAGWCIWAECPVIFRFTQCARVLAKPQFVSTIETKQKWREWEREKTGNNVLAPHYNSLPFQITAYDFVHKYCCW